MSRPEMPAEHVNTGSVRPTIHDSTSSRPMRMNIARNRPMRRANSCFSLGSLSTRIEMKMMLSMPSTSSSAVRVKKAIQATAPKLDQETAMLAGATARSWVAAEVAHGSCTDLPPGKK
jgi:hypothetical protein